MKDTKTMQYKRDAASGFNRDALKNAIIEDCKNYRGEDRMVFIGSDRFMARQLLDSVSKNINGTTYCTIRGNYCNIPAHIRGYDKFGRAVKSLPMVYVAEVMLLLQANTSITVDVYDSNDQRTNTVIYRRIGNAWNLVFTYDNVTAKVLNSVITVKPDARKRIAGALNVPACPVFHKAFDEILEELKRRE